MIRQETPDAVLPPKFPGLSKLGPKVSELEINAESTRKIISTSSQTLLLQKKIDLTEAHLKIHQDMISKFSDSWQWDAIELSDSNIIILREKEKLEDLVAEISYTLTELDSIKEEWKTRQAFWHEWKIFLEADNGETLKRIFDEANEIIEKILEDLGGTINGIFVIQGRASRMLNENIKLAQIIETAFIRQRSSIFVKNEKSLFNPNFYSRFDSAFWHSIRDNFGNFETHFEKRSERHITARVIIFISCVFLLFMLRVTAQFTKDRLFFLNHPWVLGIFLSAVLGHIFFLDQLTGPVRYLEWTFLIFSALILISGFLNITPKLSVICFFALFVTVPGLLKMISLLYPLFRIYWACTTLTGMILLLMWSRQLRYKLIPGRSFFSKILPAGAFIMALATVSQVAGFVAFFEQILFGALKIAFLVSSLFLLLKISSATIMLSLKHPLLADMAFIRHSGTELGSRLETILKVAIWGIIFLYLMTVIGVYSSAGKAFEELFLYQMTLGNLTLSPAMIILALLVLYISSFVSLSIRAILESEIFPRVQMDIGSSQSITKLLHYILILIGLLISMSLIGIDLKGFAILGGALGIGIGFGLQDIVGNFISGLILLFERPIRVGDRIEADNQLGIVKKIGLRSTIIETLDQAQIIVPNSQLVFEKVTNWTHSGTVARLKIPVSVAYGSNMALVFDALISAARTKPGILIKPEPVARLMGFGDFGLNVELRVWLQNVNERRRLQTEISMEILRRFDEYGIEIPFPQQDIRLKYQKETCPTG